MRVCVKGTSGSSVSVRVYHVIDPTFNVYGPATFNHVYPIADQEDWFIAYHATDPYFMRVINGHADSTKRATNAYIDLNDDNIVGPSDLGTGIATLTRDVYPLPETMYEEWCHCFSSDISNLITLRNEDSDSTYLTVQVRGTDATAPSLSVSTPAETLKTEDRFLRVAGSANDLQTKVLVTIRVGDSLSARSPVHGNVAFSDSVSLPVDGPYTITVSDTNSAGLSTSSVVRHIIRDTQAPILTVNRPGSSFAAVDSDSVAISVTWSDSIATNITIDGDTVASGKSGTFTKSKYPLDLG